MNCKWFDPKKKLFLLRRLSVVCIEMACLCLFLLPCFAEQPFIEMIWLMSFLRAGNDPGTSHRNITQEHLTLMSSIHRFPLSCCSALVTQFLPQFPSWAKCISKNGLKSVYNPALLHSHIPNLPEHTVWMNFFMSTAWTVVLDVIQIILMHLF